ncbi:MAG: LysM peptidoglycan-binding domain-containing protein [Saprospiraceae bacterium]
MSLQDKYRPVLDLGEKLNVKDGYVKEEDGKLKMGGTTHTQYEKNLLWDKIKEIGGEVPSDLAADIRVETTDYYAKHTVSKGETLGKIAKQYYDNAGAYMKIFNANTDILKNPDMIHPDQVLTIPFPEEA